MVGNISQIFFVFQTSQKKLLNCFILFLTTPDEVEKSVKLIEKTSEAKIMMQSSSSDDSVRHYDI